MTSGSLPTCKHFVPSEVKSHQNKPPEPSREKKGDNELKCIRGRRVIRQGTPRPYVMKGLIVVSPEALRMGHLLLNTYL